MSILESNPLEQLCHDLTLGNYFDRGRQIMVGGLVFCEHTPDERNEYAGIESIGLRYGEMLRSGKFQDHEVTSGLQHSIHLCDALLYAFKIADPESGGHCIKLVIFVSEGDTVLLLESDARR